MHASAPTFSLSYFIPLPLSRSGIMIWFGRTLRRDRAAVRFPLPKKLQRRILLGKAKS